MTLWKAFLLAVIALLIGTGIYVVSMIRRGFDTREEPSRLEIVLARTVRNLAIPSSAKEEKNPWAARATPDVLESARAHWADHCATCHANDGSGNTEVGRNLYPKAPDMRLAATQNLSDGQLYYIIRNGVRLTGMPAWSNPNLEQDDESWQLVLFIRHLPNMIAQEAEEMKALNPRTDADRAEELREQEFLNGGEVPNQPSGEGHSH